MNQCSRKSRPLPSEADLICNVNGVCLSQYAFFRPAISIVGIICEAFGKLCPEEYSVYFAEVYLEAFDVSAQSLLSFRAPTC